MATIRAACDRQPIPFDEAALRRDDAKEFVSLVVGHPASLRAPKTGFKSGTETWKLIPRPNGGTSCAVIQFLPPPTCVNSHGKWFWLRFRDAG